MISISSLFAEAQLAEASYADLTGPQPSSTITDPQQTKARLVAEGFSDAQATAFVSLWRVVDHIPDTASGFSATLFERLDAAGNGTGEFNLAIRGSTSFADFSADAGDIFLDGMAQDQLVDLYNYWQRLSTLSNNTYAAAKLVTLQAETIALNAAYLLGPAAGLAFEAVLRARADVIIDNPTHSVRTIQFVDSSTLGDVNLRQGLTGALPDGLTTLSVSGHSLGGHLAMAFTRLFPLLDASAVGVNGLGFRPSNSNVDHMFALLGGAAGFDAGKIYNVYGLAGPEFAAQNTALLNQVGCYQGIYIENGGLSTVGGHRTNQMTDSLALYDLFAKIDPAFNTTDPAVGIGKISNLLEAASNSSSDTLERLVNSLVNFLGLEFTPLAGALIDKRDELYKRVVPLQAVIKGLTANSALTVDVLTTATAADLANLAQGSEVLGYRYALKELNPFAILGNNDLYASHNASGDLDLYNPATGFGMTQTYLTLRAEMLSWKNRYFAADGNIALRSNQIETRLFENKKSGTETDVSLRVGGSQRESIDNPAKIIFGSADGETIIGGDVAAGDHLFGGGGDDTLLGFGGNDYLEGNAGADILNGWSGRDTLVGGAGNDILYGGPDGDTLDGGPGFDTYLIQPRDGPDVITDSDGQGEIHYDGVRLTGGRKAGDLWRSEDDKFTYTLIAESDGTNTLSIGSPGGTFFVKNFVSGRLNINLEDAPPPVLNPPATVREFRGDYAYRIFINPDMSTFPPGYHRTEITSTEYPLDYIVFDELDNVLRDPSQALAVPEPESFYWLKGSGGSDYMVGSNFGNVFIGNGGDDHISGGTDSDRGGGGDGEDFIEGGSFADRPLEEWLTQSIPFPEGEVTGQIDDVFGGGAGNDVMFGGTEAGLEALLDPATPAAEHKGDLLSGMEGDDELYGSTGDDVLLGGHGKDEMFGGAGDDFLDGDDRLSQSHATFVSAAGSTWDVQVGDSPFDVRFFPMAVTPFTDHSASYYKLAGDDDVLFGGGGDDILFGMLGNDLLDGEADDDTLAGWEGDDSLWGGDGNDTMAGDFGRYEQPNDRLVAFGNSVPVGFLDWVRGDSGSVDQVGDDFLDGGAGIDLLYGEGGEDIVLGGEGDDQLWGDASYLPDELHGADYLDGGAGDDVLYGGGRDDTLLGGAGNDVLEGGEGSDTYVFERGDGQDVVSDVGTSGIDVLIVNDYTQDELTIQRRANGTVVLTGAGGDEITVSSAAGDEGYGIEQIQFADGTTLSKENLATLSIDEGTIGGEDWNTLSADNDTISTAGLPAHGGFVMVDAGAGNDTVSGDFDAVVFGGTGDDSLSGGFTLLGGEGNDDLADGVTMVGGTGDDTISGGTILNGGPGDDILDGGAGPDRYLFDAGETGRDLVRDSGNAGNAILDAYYDSLGIDDWQARADVTSTQYIVPFGDGETVIFDTFEEVRDFFEDSTMTLAEALERGVTVLEPLPPAPRILANDYAALAPYHESGVIALDTVEFSGGVTPDGVALSWSETPADFEGNSNPTPHVTLDIGVNDTNTVSVVIPRSGDPAGSGIEQFVFVDGVLLTIAELIAMAPAAPDFDPPIIGTADADVLVGASSDDVILGLDGNDQLRGQGGNDQIAGGEGDDRLEGGDGKDLILAGPGNDELWNDQGSDLFIGNAGEDSLDLQSPDNIIAFNAGDGQDTLNAGNVMTLSLGGGIQRGSLALSRDGADLTLALGGTDSIRLSGWFDAAPEDWAEARLQWIDGADINIYDFTAVVNEFAVALEQDPGLASYSIDSALDSHPLESHPDRAIGGALAYEYATQGNLNAFSADEVERALGHPGFGLIAEPLEIDHIVGTSGNDVISGSAGADTLAGGLGNDSLEGGAGDDTYLFNPGDGVDTLTDSGGSDTLSFGDGITADMLTLGLGSLLIQIGDTGDAIHIDGFDPENVLGSGAIENFRFANGLCLTYGELVARGFDILGTDGDDTLSGTSANDRIEGLGGDDVLLGRAGNDIYFFNRGDGSDTIEDSGGSDSVRFGEGIGPGDFSVNREGGTLTLGFDSGEQLSLEGIERVEFFDGTVVLTNRLDLNFTLLEGTPGDDELFSGADGNEYVRGLEGNDFIYGEDGDDLLEGGAGDDHLFGGAGDDVYVFAPGDGADTVLDQEGSDTLEFAEGITPNDLVITTAPDGGLQIGVAGSGDRVVISEWFNDPIFQVENVAFADGTAWDTQEIESRVTAPSGTEGDDEMTGTPNADSMDGLTGDDELNGLAGDDVLAGGPGDDYLEGGDGNDVLDGGEDSDDLAGGDGNDYYIFGRGYGHDAIEDEGGDGDVVRFNADVAPVDVVATRDLYHSIYLSVSGTPDRLQIKYWFSDDGAGIERVEFADGTAWDASQIAARIVPAVATEFGDALSGTDADDFIAGLGGGDEIYGGAGNDVLFGNEGDDYFDDGDGRNYLSGGAGNDYFYLGSTSLFAGGSGDDHAEAYGQDNIIAFNRGDGDDTYEFYEWNGIERFALSLGGGLGLSDLSFSRDDYSSLIINAGNGDVIRLAGWYSDPYRRVTGLLQVIADDVRIYDLSAAIAAFDATYADDPGIGEWSVQDALAGNVLSVSTEEALGGEIAYRYGIYGHTADLSLSAMQDVLADPDFGRVAQSVIPPEEPENHAPMVASGIADQVAIEDAAFTFGVPADTFADEDAADALTLSASLSNGDPLPAWLEFAPETGAFYGTPGNDEVGTLSVQVTVTDRGGLFVSDTFDIAVANTNDAPLVANALPDQMATEDQIFDLTVQGNTYADVDAGDSLAYSASLADGSALPAWLNFDAASGIFSGMPANEDADTISVKVTATDGSNASATDEFDLTVANVNDAPMVANAIADQAAAEDTAFSFTVPANTFADVDAGDTLTFGATSTDGSLLPEWLSFDPISGTFSGMPTNDEVGTLNIRVTASDTAGAAVSDEFALEVVNVNDAPEVIAPLADQAANQNAPFIFTLPSDTFTDVDTGDILALSVTLADGSAFPAWLAFDAVGATFSGTPSEFDMGSMEIRVSATDNAGATAEGTFLLSISDASTINETHLGTRRGDVITTGFANDLIDAGRGDDLVHAGAGRDIVFGGRGEDRLYGEAGNDRLYGGRDDDRLEGGSGFDLLYGGRGRDRLEGGAGDDLLSGGAGHDHIAGGEGGNIVIGGAGHDVITGGSGAEVFVVNFDDGKDTLRLSGAAVAGNEDVLSLGGGIAAGDLSLKRDHGDLIVEARGADECDERARVTLKDWYRDAGDHQSVTTLQLFEGDIASTYDFKALVARFDAATQGRFRTGRWAAERALAEVRLGSDSEPLGGAIAREYAASGTVLGDVPLTDEDAEERAALPGGNWDEAPALPARDKPEHYRGSGRHDGDRGDHHPRGKHDPIAELLEDYLAHQPRYDFEALAHELDRSNHRGESLNAHEIARRWQAVGRYARGLADERDEDARHGAGGESQMGRDLLGAGALGGGFGHAGSTGTMRGVGNLKTLQGLAEGFDRLRT